MANEKLDTEKQLNQPTEKTDILPEKELSFNEDGSVNFPAVTLSNPGEALKYVRGLETRIIEKTRESNEVVVDELKDMLECAFNGGYHSDINRNPEKGYEKSAVCSDYSYESDRRYYVDGPIKFLSEYHGSLQNFMDLLAQEIKGRECGRGDSFIVMCQRFGVSNEELLAMDNVTLIEKIKEDIKNIPSLGQSHDNGNMREHLGAARFYLTAIRNVCKKLGYK